MSPQAAAQVGEARFSVIIRGEGMAFDQVSGMLTLAPTYTRRRGEVINRLPEILASADEWVYEIPLTEPEGTDSLLNDLLSTLLARRGALGDLQARYSVGLRLYVQSDRAQIAYRLMPDTLAKLVGTGLPLDLTSLSWGEIGL